MKRKLSVGQIVYLVIAAIAIVALFGLVGYEIYTKRTLETETMMKGLLVLASLIFSMFRVFGVGRGEKAPSVKILRESYAAYIGEAFANDPKREKAFFAAVADYNQNRIERALRRFEALEGKFARGDELYAIRLFQALCYSDLKLWDNAIRAYKEAFAIKPTATVMSNLGTCYESKGDSEAAIEAYHRAMELDPENPYPFSNLAQIYLLGGEFEGALTYAEQALSLNDTISQAHSARAICLAMLGQEQAYTKALQQAILHGVDPEIVEGAVKFLRAAADDDGEQEED